MGISIIVGLGNPGPQYKSTRHNLGFMFVDRLAERLGLPWLENKKFQAKVAKNSQLILVKPLTFMNDSGRAVASILKYHKLLPENPDRSLVDGADLSHVLTVIHDDLDIDFGSYKLSRASRSAGHKGVESIIACLKTKIFNRVRIGIKKTAADAVSVEKYVLQKFNQDEFKVINKLLDGLLINYMDDTPSNNLIPPRRD